MNARQVEAIAGDLARSRRRIREATKVAVICLVVSLAAAPFSFSVAAAFAAGAVAGALLATFGKLTRQGQIEKLALDPLAYELPEVSRFAELLTTRHERERLAAWIVEILGEAASIPGNRYLTARVVRYAEELAALGDDLCDRHAEIRPSSAAAAHLLLTGAVDSPLYNPAIPAERLPAIIASIRLGITRSTA